MSVFDNLQVGDDIQAPAPSNGAIDSAGRPTATPTGRIDYGQVADSLRQMPDVSQQKPSAAPPVLPSTSDDQQQPVMPPVAPAAPQTVQEEPKQPIVAPIAPAAPVSKVFDGIDAVQPTVQQQNQDALNPPQPPTVQSYVQQQTDQKEAMALKLFSPQQIADFKANPITMSNITQMGHLFNINDIIPGAQLGSNLVGNETGTREDSNLSNIVTKIQGMTQQEAMHTLTIGEQNILMDAARKYTEIQMRGFAPDWGGKGAKAVFDFSSLPSWMIQFTAGGELAAGAKAITGLVGADAAGLATVARAVPFLPNIVAGQGDALLNQSIAITDKGQTYLQRAQDSPSWALLHSTANVLEDNALALTGGKILDTALKTPISYAVNKLAPEVRQSIYQAFQAIEPSAQMSKVFSTGWEHVLNVLGFAVTDPAAHAATNSAMTKNYTFDNFKNDAIPTTESLILGLGIAAISGSASFSSKNATGILTGRGMPPDKAADVVSMMSENERELFVNSSLQMPKSEYPTAPSTVSQNSDAEIMKAQVKSSEQSSPPPIHDEESNYNNTYRSTFSKVAEQLYAEAVNRVQPIENLSPRAIARGAEIPAGENTENLVSMAQSVGLADANLSFKRFYREDGTGRLVESGKSLKAILDDFDNMFMSVEPDRGQRQADFSKYQTARRQVYLDETRPVSEATPKELKEHQQTIDDLEEKYGSKFTKFDNNYTDRSKETWEKTFSKTETDAEQRQQDFKDYTNTREQLDIKAREYKLTPEQKEARLNDIGELSEKYGKNFSFFETLFKEHMEYRSGTYYDHLVRTGLKSQAEYDAMVKNNDIYAPDYRHVPEDDEKQFSPSAQGQLERNPNADKIGSVGNQAKGSELESKNVIESDIKNTVSMVTRGENNRMKLSIAKHAEFYPDDVQLVNEPSRTSITYFENGEKKYMEVSPVLQKAFESFSKGQQGIIDGWIDSIMNPTKKLLQIGATSMPQFLVGHFERSVQLGFINSFGKATPMDFIRGIYHVIGNTENFKEFKAATGLGVGRITLDDPALEKMRLDIQSGMKITDLCNPKYIHDTLMKYADMPARVATYNGLIAKGVPQLEAAIQARQNTMDYSRMGSFVKDKLSFAPFLNPPIQGMDKMLNLFYKHPAAMTKILLLSQTLPQVMLTGYYLFGADDDTRKAYLEIPAEDRFVHQYIHFGNDPNSGWVGIRRPFTPGYIFGSMPEQMMIHEYVSKKGGAEPANFYSTMLHGLAASGGILTDPMSAFPPLVKAAIEGATNYNMFWGQPLFKGDKDLPKSEWRTPSDTDFANWLGGKLNASPAMIDNTISDMSGGLGKWAVQEGGNLWNDASRAMGNKVAQPPTDQNNFMSGFTVKPSGYSSQSVQEFYDRFNEAQSINKQAKALDKNDPVAAQKYRDDNADQLNNYETLAGSGQNAKYSPMAQIRGISKQIRDIKADTEMSGDEKQSKINDLNNQMTDVARQANSEYDSTTKRGK